MQGYDLSDDVTDGHLTVELCEGDNRENEYCTGELSDEGRQDHVKFVVTSSAGKSETSRTKGNVLELIDYKLGPVFNPLSQHQQEEVCRTTQDDQPSRWAANPDIQYRYSEAKVDLIPLLKDPIASAVQNSQQWRWERYIGTTVTTDCMNVLLPRDPGKDMSITFLAGFDEGLSLIKQLSLKLIEI